MELLVTPDLSYVIYPTPRLLVSTQVIGRLVECALLMKLKVADWLESSGFGEYKNKFVENHITGVELLSLTGDELREDIGIESVGHRKRILNCIAKLPRQDHASNEPGYYYEISLDEVDTSDKCLGKGAFGAVYSGVCISLN